MTQSSSRLLHFDIVINISFFKSAIIWNKTSILVAVREFTMRPDIHSGPYHIWNIVWQNIKTYWPLVTRVACYHIVNQASAKNYRALNKYSLDIWTVRHMAECSSKLSKLNCFDVANAGNIKAILLTKVYTPLHQHGLTLIPAWISNYIHYEMQDEMCGMILLVHSLTSWAQPLNFGNG